MTKEERLSILKNRIPQADREGFDDAFFSALLESAKSHIQNARYPYDDKKRCEDVEERYHIDQVEICLRMFSRIGAEGETSHSEGGIARTYYDPSGFKDILDNITPYCGVL